jgi:hypothetical protein
MVADLNEELANDGCELFEKKQLSGRPVYGARQIDSRVEIFKEPTGWAKVDRQMDEVRLRLREASTEEHFQAVGLICREVLISLAQEVYVADKHPSPDGQSPSKTDARRMLGAYISSEFRGSSNEELRRHANASLSLALSLQHDRTADFKTAALCAEATASVVNIIGIIAEVRVSFRSSEF